MSSLSSLFRSARNRETSRLLRVSLLWNGTSIHSEVMRTPRRVEVGAEARGGLVIPTDVIPPRFEMFVPAPRDAGYDVGVTSQLRGTITLDGTTRDVAELFPRAPVGEDGARRIRISGDDWGTLDFGDVSLLFQLVRPMTRSRGRFPLDLWIPAGLAVAVLAVLMVAFFAVSSFDYPCVGCAYRAQTAKTLRVDANLLARQAEPPPVEVPESLDVAESGAKRAGGVEGAFGAPEKQAIVLPKLPKRDGRKLTRVESKQVSLVDLLASSSSRTGALANVLADTKDVLVNKLAVAMNGTDDALVLGPGSNGMGFRGLGSGGGGPDGDIGGVHGLGDLDGPGGPGDGVRSVAGLKRKKPARVHPTRVTGTGTTSGFCEKGDIMKNVRLRSAAVRQCYEARLQIDATLAGKVTVRWSIDADGHTSNVALASSTLTDHAVGECVMRTVRRMRFKKPEGGLCVVQWPFVFNSGR